MADQIPDFMQGHEHHGKEQSLKEDPEFWVARALLMGGYKNDPDRLCQMLQSTEVSNAQTVAEWRHMMGDYPEVTLADGKMTKYENEDVPVRAFVLKQAITRLFELCDAPDNLKIDLELLMDSFLENPAWKKARLQELRLANPDASWTEIADLADANYSQVMKDKKAWLIAHNPD